MQKYICFLFYIISIFASSQSNNPYQASIPNLIPPSPTSRIFQKFTGYPISHATGTININIPLYDLTYNGLSIPFELKYHSSGVKIQDPVGVVGRNWALFPGFKISRTIKGKPDETFPVKYIGSPTILEQFFLSSPYLSPDCKVNGITEERIDGQNDIFQISMPNMDGSFILNEINNTVTVETIPKKPWKIKPLLDSDQNYIYKRLYGFELIDNQGIRYLFGESSPIRGETSYVETNPVGSPFFYLSGWMLREIVFPNNEKVSFKYKSIREDLNNYDASISVIDNGIEVPSVDGCPSEAYAQSSLNDLGSGGYDVSENLYSRNSIYYSLLPTLIESPNSTITLSYSSEKLSSALIAAKDGKKIKKIDFSYHKSGELLTKVSLEGEGDYELKYYDDDPELGRIDDCFDWWGYCNMRNGNNSSIMIPSIYLNIVATPVNGAEKRFIQGIGKSANREPNGLYMKAWSLEKITYPTGGTLKINYEPHQFQAYRFNMGTKNEIGAGIRVSSTESYDPISKKTIKKSYLYEDAHYTGLYYPDASCLITTKYLCAFSIRGGIRASRIRQRTLSVFSSQPFINENPIQVWYGKVTEESDDAISEYKYDFITDLYSTNNTDKYCYDNHYPPEYYISTVYKLIYPSPWSVSEVYYNNTNNEKRIRQVVKYNYTTIANGYKQRNIILPFQVNKQEGSVCDFLEYDNNCMSYRNYLKFGLPVNSFNYNIQIGNQVMASTTKTIYTDKDSIKELTSYKYDPDRPYNITHKEETSSNGEALLERYYYSNSVIPHAGTLSPTQQNIIAEMESSNYQTSIIEQTKEKSGRIIAGNMVGYKKVTTDLYRPETLYYYDNQFSPRVEYNNYNDYGNPLYLSKDDATKIVYLWSYSGQHPIAEIKNVTYEDVNKIININTLSAKLEPSESDYKAIRALETSLKNALITTYTYKPLVGMTSMTDPRGVVTTYEYDSFGRLSKVKDANGKVINTYDYHYQRPLLLTPIINP